MITLQKAKELIDSEVASLPSARIPIDEACGCILAADIESDIDVPSFPSSAMDGITVRSSDLKGDSPWRMEVVTTIAAGDTRSISLREGQAAKIMTGAPVPRNADLVIPVEEVSFQPGSVMVTKKRYEKDYIRPPGDDIRAGQKLYSSGVRLTALDAGVLASVGITHVSAIPRPRLALFSTGREVVRPGRKLRRGQIYDSNSASLSSLLRGDGFEVAIRTRALPDHRRPISRVFREALQANDLLLTSGAVSAGEFDYIPEVIRSIGGEIIFHRVAIKPGKPVMLARVSQRYIIGLPGNPVSAVVGYHLFVRRVLSRMMGMEHIPRSSMARLGSDMHIRGSRLGLIGARIERDEDCLIAHPAAGQKSGRLYSIAGIDGFIFADGGSGIIEKNSKVYVEWL